MTFTPSALAYSSAVRTRSPAMPRPPMSGGTMVWVMACALFECNVMLTLAQEKNEFNLQSAALVLLMLFTYSKLWVVVVLRAMWMTVKKIVSKTDYTWYKTERSAD